MAVGDVVSDNQSIAAAGVLDIQPAASVEWVIHNIYFEAEVTVEVYDGTNSIIFASLVGPDFLGFNDFHCTNSKRLRVKNNNAAAKRIGYDGMQTK